MRSTKLTGARAHNLKGVDLEIRPGEVTVLTGVSGAGKSSLALDTLYAEGQRRFVESFSPYARQFLERLERPPMTALEPVGAGVAVDRSAPIKSSRSTVATMADLEPYLAGLFAKESAPHCPEHHEAAVEMDLARATQTVLERFVGERLLITAPHLVGDRDEYLGLRDDLLREGYRRVVCGDALTDLDSLKPSIAAKAGRLHVVLDRVRAEQKHASRIRESLELAFRRSAGLLTSGQSWVFSADTLAKQATAANQSLHLRQGLSCPTCARGFLPPRPGYFSYENPLGACDNCRGFGRVLGIDLDKVFPDPTLSLAGGAIRPWRGPKATWERRQLKKVCEDEGIDFRAPWEDLPTAQQRLIIEGKGKGKRRSSYFGVSDWFEWLETKSYKMHVRVLLSRYRSYDPCPVCDGTRLQEQSRWYKLGDLDLGQWHQLEVDDALKRLESLQPSTPHGRLLQKEFASRLRYLARVGLGYLTLDRQARTLSGGEAQRVTLTAALGTSLHNALFVLDEPTVGLHPADIAPLTELIGELAARQNAVVVIEHEPLVIARADRVVELGPGAGERGGELTFDGTVAAARKAKGATARALRGPKLTGATSQLPSTARTLTPTTTRASQTASATTARASQTAQASKPEPGVLSLRRATANNLQNVDLDLPLRQLVAVSGPSGSGKSSLVVDVLYRAIARHLHLEVERPGEHTSLDGAEHITAIELVDQSPLGRTSRGNPATYTKCWDTVRKLFAAEPEAAAGGITPSHFSFNVAGGRCEACSGEGSETVEMQFLADVSLVCPVCQGRRFKDEILEIRHRDKSISDILEMTVADALDFFDASAPIRRALTPLRTLGLGYLRLGQPLSTLSGGEAQRLKLARALAAPKPGNLYILDEPSAGLHADEIALVVEAMRVLVRASGTVIFVDHDLPLIAAADHVVELGPGGGAAGGKLVFQGSPAELAQASTRTGLALAASSSTAGRRRRAKAPSAAVLSVQGAREHTLHDISVDLPHQQLTVVTGPSGSGKSTLAFDVVFAEGQRRFLETLTPYARRFLPTMPRPNVDAVDGVPPSIALEQRTTRIGTRSTVATVTEVAHYLRLLFAKLGTVHCPQHDLPITRATAEELLALAQRLATSPIAANAKNRAATSRAATPRAASLGAATSRAASSRAASLGAATSRAATSRAATSGAASSRAASSAPSTAKKRPAQLAPFAALLAPVVRSRKGTYLDVFTSAARAGFPWAVADGKRVSTDRPPRLAKTREHDIDIVVEEGVDLSKLSLDRVRELLRWGRGNLAIEIEGERHELSTGGACPECGFSVGELDPRYFSFNTTQGQCARCEGTGREPAPKTRGKKKAASERPVCRACKGVRLSPLASGVRLEGKTTYPDLTALSVAELLDVVKGWRFDGRRAAIAEPIVPELKRRLAFLCEVGLDYLSLDRDARTLSGGEIQRLRLAAQLGAGLTGALYVLDEPTIGLHPRDTGRLIGNLKKLVDTGSTVVLVEHDEDVIRAADHLVDLGPGGGTHGGQLMATGSPKKVLASKKSPTAKALRAKRTERQRLLVDASTARISLEGARHHNLVGDDLHLPLGRMNVVAGVSGSGKSTLIRHVLLPALQKKLHRVGEMPGSFKRLVGTEPLHRAVAVDQSPIGRTPRSVPATFLGIFDLIRKLFAKAPQAQVRGFDASRFSFNTPKGGRCTVCEGQGVIAHEMSFLPDVVTTCPACDGLRFEDRTLEVDYLGRTIGQVLQLSAEEAVEVFAAHPKIIAPLQVLCDLGAGYISLGQGSHTLSGGEAQRLKLAAELTAGARHEATLYVLDEPTTGLHVSDVDRLVQVLDRLVERGDTLVVIEHQPDVIAAADWVVELGPEGGPQGGRIVFEGTPKALTKRKTATGQVLASR